MSSTGIAPAQITGVVLAGGRGARMGGVDKGLQLFNGVPLALHALRRLQAQVGTTLLNANRNIDDYRAFGVPVFPDTVPDYAGPLAGFVSALEHCTTTYLVTVPCDSPLFPTDLVARLASALTQAQADIAMVSIQGAGPAQRAVGLAQATRVLPAARNAVAGPARFHRPRGAQDRCLDRQSGDGPHAIR